MNVNKTIGMRFLLPVFLKEKYHCSVCYARIDYVSVKVGDKITLDKLPETYDSLLTQKKYEVESCNLNLFEKSCTVMLKKAVFENQNIMDKFLNGKNKILVGK